MLLGPQHDVVAIARYSVGTENDLVDPVTDGRRRPRVLGIGYGVCDGDRLPHERRCWCSHAADRQIGECRGRDLYGSCALRDIDMAVGALIDAVGGIGYDEHPVV